MKITRTQAVAILTAFGITTSATWALDRMQTKLSACSDLLGSCPRESVPAELQPLYDELTAAMAATPPTAVTVEDDGTATATTKAKKPKGKKAAAVTTEGTTPDGAAAPAAAAPAKAEKAPKPAKPTPTTTNVRPTNGRKYQAARLLVLANFRATNPISHDKGLPHKDELVAAVDAAVGKANPVQTAFDVAHGWQALNGVLAGLKEAGFDLKNIGLPEPLAVEDEGGAAPAA